jgi:hypothetical protein
LESKRLLEWFKQYDRCYAHGIGNKIAAIIDALRLYFEGENEGLVIAKRYFPEISKFYESLEEPLPEPIRRIKYELLPEIKFLLEKPEIVNDCGTLEYFEEEIFKGILEEKNKYAKKLEELKFKLKEFPEYAAVVFKSDRDNPERWKDVRF